MIGLLPINLLLPRLFRKSPKASQVKYALMCLLCCNSIANAEVSLAANSNASATNGLFGSQLYTQEIDWKLKRNRKGIQIFLGNVDGSAFHAVLSIMRVKTQAKNLAALVMDLDNCPKWAAMCKTAKIHRQISPNRAYVYSLNDAPFPVRDRDVVAQVNWSYDSSSGRISMLSRAVSDQLPKTKGVIRVEKASSEWHFTPQADGTVLVENYAHVDPNGVVPAWLTNIMIIDAPYKTMKRMRRIVESGKYDEVELAQLINSEAPDTSLSN